MIAGAGYDAGIVPPSSRAKRHRGSGEGDGISGSRGSGGGGGGGRGGGIKQYLTLSQLPNNLVRVGKLISVNSACDVSVPKLTITLDAWLSDLDSVASSLFVATAVEDVSDAAGPGRKCMLQLQPLIYDPSHLRSSRAIAGRYVRFSNWQVVVFCDGPDTMRMVFGTPALDSALAKWSTRRCSFFGGLNWKQIQEELDNQAIYIQRPELVQSHTA